MRGAKPIGVEVSVHVDDSEDPPQSEKLRQKIIAELILRVLEEEGVSGGVVDLVFCGDGRITELNETWFGREGPTDVIAFDLSEDPDNTDMVEGEIYIDLAQAERQAPQFDSTFDEEVRRLVIHGVLHLSGYDDTSSPEEAERMTQRQEYYVAGWGKPVLKGAR